MKIPLSLIRSYLPFDEPLPTLCEILTLLGIEVDGVQNPTPPFSHVVAALVRSTAPHPSADKLQVAEVYDGKETWQVVCGAANCRPGLKTAFAKIGALLYDDQGRERKIVGAEIRGVKSQGMLSSYPELSIPGPEEGIIELPPEVKEGQDLTELLWDPILDISLTPNLGHCMSALGIARELSCSLQKPLQRPAIVLKENSSSSIHKKISVKVQNPESCPRYACRWIENVKIGPSPFWLQQALLRAGFRPINNAVDVTNYMLLKTGQPLHAFDADRIANGSLLIQTLERETAFRGLDGNEHTLPTGALVIADANGPLALAGILGGADSGVTEATQSILLEVAAFDALLVRKTAHRLGLRTDSSQRFEKGTDGEAIPDVLNEAALLLSSLTGGTIAKGMIDEKAPHFGQKKEIELRDGRVNTILGTELSLGEIEEFLKRAEMKIRKHTSSLHVLAPSFRNDLHEEIDLVEEVARLYGYNNIDKKAPRYTTSLIPHDPLFLFERDVRHRAISLGLQEILTCDLISSKVASLAAEIGNSKTSLIQVLHAKSEEYSVLRPSLLPGMLEVVRFNLDQKNPTLLAFETGHIYFKDSQIREIPMLAIALTGKNKPHHFDPKPTDVDFYDLKGFLEALLESLSIPDLSFQKTSEHLSFHPGRQANLMSNGLLIGSLGELHPHLLKKADIKQRTLFAELNLAQLFALQKPRIKMSPLPQFPSTSRDWTITLPEHIDCERLFQTIRSFHAPLLEKVELIDLYLRNATVRFTYRDPLKTLSFEEAESLHKEIVAEVSSKL
jgi:phenylalanyl-tRNA synthetase beta chain